MFLVVIAQMLLLEKFLCSFICLAMAV